MNIILPIIAALLCELGMTAAGGNPLSGLSSPSQAIRDQASALYEISDAYNRLVGVSVAPNSGEGLGGYNWTTVYDGFGRRVQTSWQPTTTAGANSGSASTLTYYYDPQVQYLELGLMVLNPNNSATPDRTWKVYGPDKSGTYGGAQGEGGLDNTVDEAGGFANAPFNNYFGDAVGEVFVSNVTTPGYTITYGYGSTYGGYGYVPGSSGYEMTPEWRGQYVDYTGFIYKGARYYEYQSGRFLSADPLGQAGSLDLYAYANGDPVNGLDPTGALGVGANMENSGAGSSGNPYSLLGNGASGDGSDSNQLTAMVNQTLVDQYHQQLYDSQPITEADVEGLQENIEEGIILSPLAVPILAVSAATLPEDITAAAATSPFTLAGVELGLTSGVAGGVANIGGTAYYHWNKATPQDYLDEGDSGFAGGYISPWSPYLGGAVNAGISNYLEQISNHSGEYNLQENVSATVLGGASGAFADKVGESVFGDEVSEAALEGITSGAVTTASPSTLWQAIRPSVEVSPLDQYLDYLNKLLLENISSIPDRTSP